MSALPASIRPRGTTAHEAVEAVCEYAIRVDDWPTRQELHKCRRGILAGIRQAITLRYLREERDPDGLRTLRITERGYDLLRAEEAAS